MICPKTTPQGLRQLDEKQREGPTNQFEGPLTKEASLSLTRTRAGAGVAEQVDGETSDGHKLGAHQG